MKYNNLILWSVKVFYLLNYIRYSSCNENKPRIVEIKQIDETSVWIKWDTSHMKDHGHYRRYDIRNSTSEPFTRWPAQTELVNYDFMGGTPIYQRGSTQMRTSQCRTMCLDDLKCLFARMDSNGCAHYVDEPQKIKYNNSSSNVVVFKMKDYSNNVIIRNVPYGRTHRFIVRVCSNEWSDPSDPVDFELNIRLKAELNRTGQNEFTIGWHQDNQNGFKYNVSRYRVQIERKSDRNQNIHKPINEIRYGNEDFEYYTLAPNSDENGDKYSALGYSYIRTVEDCREKCKQNNGCVRFIYNPTMTSVNNGLTVRSESCYIMTNAHIHIGRLLPNTTVAYSIKSNQNKMVIGDLPFNDEYVFTVIGTTPFGDDFKSNEIDFYFGDITPTFYIKTDNMNLQIKIEWEFNKTANVAQLNPTYYINYTIGNQKSVSYAKGEKIDDIVINDALVETEYSFNIQILINKQYMLNIKPLKAFIKFSAKVLYSSQTDGGMKLTCNYREIKRKYTKKISWFKESKLVDLNALQASQDKTSNDLILRAFNYKLHYGNYTCKVTVREQTIESDTLRDIKFPPKIQFLNVTGNRQTVVESDSVTITCVCESNPITEIRLKYKSLEIDKDKLELVKEDLFTYKLSYKIDSFNISEHDGLYECHTTPDATHKDILFLWGSVKSTSDEQPVSLKTLLIIIIPSVIFVTIIVISIIIYRKYKKGGFRTENDNIQVFYIDGYIVFEDPYENFAEENNNNNESRNATSNQLDRNSFVRASEQSISVFSDLSEQNNSGYIN